MPKILPSIIIKANERVKKLKSRLKKAESDLKKITSANAKKEKNRLHLKRKPKATRTNARPVRANRTKRPKTVTVKKRGRTPKMSA